MAKKKSPDRNFYILAVKVAAELNRILHNAESISLDAMNAKALVARAGEDARTFKPITDYMTTLAKDTIQLVGKINGVAIHVSRVSLTEMLAEITLNNTLRHKPRIDAATYGESLRPAISAQRLELRNQTRRLAEATSSLTILLLEMEQQMLGAKVVSGTARLEAANCDPKHKAHFQAIAESLENASETIRKSVTACRNQIQLHTRNHGL